MDFYPSSDFDGDGDNTELDFNPTLIRRVFLTEDGKVYADVYSDPDFLPSADSVLEILEQLADIGRFDNPDFEHNPEGYPKLPDNFFNTATDIRGPFSTNDQIQKWLYNSGLKGIAKVFYDPISREFYIDVNTN